MEINLKNIDDIFISNNQEMRLHCFCLSFVYLKTSYINITVGEWYTVVRIVTLRGPVEQSNTWTG